MLFWFPLLLFDPPMLYLYSVSGAGAAGNLPVPRIYEGVLYADHPPTTSSSWGAGVATEFELGCPCVLVFLGGKESWVSEIFFV